MKIKRSNFFLIIKRSLLCSLAAGLFFAQSLPAFAEDEIEARLAAQRAMEVQSNTVENWPTGPTVSAESAILIEAGTGAVLYAKNIHEKEYPASTTKILTTLIAAEECSLDEIVTFSHNAVFSIDRSSNHIAIDEGEELTMEQCLNAILIRSANEVSNAVAEHISGTTEAFAQKMNERARELGCVDSNFVNPNGLPDENHYTSAYDLAQIGRAFFDNEMLCNISTTTMLRIPPSDKQPDNIVESSSNEMLQGGEYAYEDLVGAKTGFTSVARSCLVSCAERNGLKLICVVLKDESPLQYEDTISLFEYGFSNFEKVNISQTETKYSIDDAGFFYSENDIFGSSQPLLTLNQDDYIVLPKTADFEDTVSSISYETQEENQAAVITYTYHDVFIGSASLDFAAVQEDTYSFEGNTQSAEGEDSQQTSFVFINIIKVILGIAGLAALIFLLLFLRSFFKNYHFSHRNTRFAWRRSKKKHRRRPQNVNKSLQKRRQAQIRDAKRRSKKRHPIKFRDYD